MNDCPTCHLVPKEYIRKGRANLRCPDCDRDVTLELVLLAEFKERENELRRARRFAEKTHEKVRLRGGKIPAGETCPYSDSCGGFERIACNSQGCPVCDGKVISNDFSCALARGLDICGGASEGR